MLRTSLSSCLRSRIASRLNQTATWPSTSSILYSNRRFRSDGQSTTQSDRRGFQKTDKRKGKDFRNKPPPAPPLYKPPKSSGTGSLEGDAWAARNEEDLRHYVVKQLGAFASDSSNIKRLKGFGIAERSIRPLLRAFRDAASSGDLVRGSNIQKYDLMRFAEPQPDAYATIAHINRVCTSLLYTWASEPAVQENLRYAYDIPPQVLSSISRLAQVTDMRHTLVERTPDARRLRRKFIMHVGPTNSGKTFDALRALASAKRGVYAGPLRLLAHEIWERLNIGEIPPLGEKITTKPEGSTTRGNPAWVRKCNMITGEEQKIVEDDAPLLSCTVEMLSMTRRFDVAVLDETQMIGDFERGGAWTNAVLGLCADEIHLCGEVTAIPVIKAIVETTGDELIIHEHQRLTPLTVQDKALDGDLNEIQKGDCVVTFSRKGIFAVKNRIEEQTGMKCVVAYGMLPPELRSEQAALFNDPDSGYDVIIGSDAIGMGLNLKIKRVIFERASKFNGQAEKPLSVSQVKQIAGRAGRFGHHNEGGFVTAMRTNDLAFIRRTLEKELPMLTHARVNIYSDDLEKVAQALPPGVKTQYLFEAITYLGRLPSVYKWGEMPRLDQMGQLMDQLIPDAALAERSTIACAPIPWRDEECLQITENILRTKETNMDVTVAAALQNSELVHSLRWVEDAMKQDTVEPETLGNELQNLEKLHRCLVLYLWLGYRNPVVYNDYDVAMELKKRTEVALDWCLAAMSEETDDADEARTRRSAQKDSQPKIVFRDGFHRSTEVEQPLPIVL